MTFKQFRILLLLSVLLVVSLYTCEQRRASTSWTKTVQLVIYPLNPNQNPDVDQYISSLTNESFTQIETFFTRQAARYKVILSQPVKVTLGPVIPALPPAPPTPGSGVLDVMIWSMKFRYWAWQHTPDDESNIRRARVFVNYHPAVEGVRLEHSYGMSKGLLGYVNAFASRGQQEQNNIIIAHEFLHTVGAKDKYGANSEPVYPIGYAEPDITPLYPQRYAEIMAGRMAVGPAQIAMPDSLQQCLINEITALEINWKK